MTALKITEGCFVRLRDGSIHGPLVRGKDEVWFWKSIGASWTKTGQYRSDRASDFDIIEVLPSPIFPSAIPTVRKSAHVTDGVTVPAGATNLALASGGVLSWDEPAEVVTLWGHEGLVWAFGPLQERSDTHRLDLHINDGEIIAAIPSRIKEGEE